MLEQTSAEKEPTHSTVLAELLARHGFRRHAMTRNKVGHLQLTARLDGRLIDMLIDTGAASTIVDLNYCRTAGIEVKDTGHLGGGAGGVALPIHALGDVALTIDDRAIRSDGIFALDLSHVNEGLTMKGAERVHAVLGADILVHHEAVIDYKTLSLFLKHA